MSRPLPGLTAQSRYLLGAPDRAEEVPPVDVLVLGAGIAGLSAALSLPPGLDVVVVLKGTAALGRSDTGAAGSGKTSAGDSGADGSSGHAQGGIAAVFAGDDSAELHLKDTLAAGAGLCEADAVGVLVEEAPDAVRFLVAHGVVLDGLNGDFDLTREGGHSRRRIVHAGGDATGREVMRGLTHSAAARGIRLLEEAFLVDLLTGADGQVCGARLLVGDELCSVRARAVVLATGGFGQLFAETTSPAVCTGDGLAAALRAGAAVADLEFVQFHPTAIQLAGDPRPLASESLRGEGATIRNRRGQAVMELVDVAGDLAPRDVVSRAMAFEMRASGTDHLFLDATAIGEQMVARFPSFVGASRRGGIDPLRSWVPVAPAVHYVMGGVCSDLWGRASLRGLYAIGEVAQSGVHGANRLASNSLVEGVVFGRRAAAALVGELPERPAEWDGRAEPIVPQRVARPWLRAEMTASAGVLRSAPALEGLLEELAARARPLREPTVAAELEDANLTLLAGTLGAMAWLREESRGAHFRLDAPVTAESWRHHQLVSRQESGELVVRDSPPTSGVLATSGDRGAVSSLR